LIQKKKDCFHALHRAQSSSSDQKQTIPLPPMSVGGNIWPILADRPG